MNKPFIKLITTPNAYYFYDVNTNNIVNVDKDIYMYLQNVLNDNEVILENLDKKIINKIEKLKEEGFLSDKKIKKIIHPETDKLEYHLSRHINQITLQITQNCNLRCSYCAYSNLNNKSQRNHSNKKMSIETAKKAIDFLIDHSCDSEEICIGFYGGEPLLEYDFLKEVISYVEENAIGKKIKYSITTNGTLLDKEKIEYLFNNNTTIMLSIDGPKEIHDINRKFISGKGSFEVVNKNLNDLYAVYGNKLKDMVSINMVVDPSNDFDKINSIFENPIFNEIPVRISIVDDSYIDKRTVYSEDYIIKDRYQLFLAMLNHFGIVNDIKYSPMMESYLLKMDVDYDDFKESFKCLPDEGVPSGPCIPGKRRLFINTDGKFFPCERVSETSEIMEIGSLDSDFNIEKIKKILNIASLTEEQCKNCFAVSKCTICAKLADDNGKFSAEKKLKYCSSVKKEVEGMIRETILKKEYNSLYRRQEE